MAMGRYTLTATVTVPAGTVAQPASNEGSVTNPGAFANIATVSVAAGTYLVYVSAFLSGTVQAADADNFELVHHDTTVITKILIPAAANAPVSDTYTVVMLTPGDIGVWSIAAASNVAAVYNASISASPVLNTVNNGSASYVGAGTPPQWSPGGFSYTFLAGTTMWLDSAGPLYAAIGAGNLTAFRDGTDNVGHAALSN